MLAMVDYDGRPLLVTRGDFSLADRGGVWVEYPFTKYRSDVLYNFQSQEWDIG